MMFLAGDLDSSGWVTDATDADETRPVTGATEVI